MSHDNDKEILGEETSHPADYVLWDGSRILIGEMFGKTLLLEEKQFIGENGMWWSR